jgi:hypothetical protein
MLDGVWGLLMTVNDEWSGTLSIRATRLTWPTRSPRTRRGGKAPEVVCHGLIM